MPESDGFHDIDRSAYLHAQYVAVIAELVRQTDGPISGVRARARSMILDYFGPEYAGLIALELCEDVL